MKIATIDLGEKPLFLAPMEDVTDPSFRFMCKRYGADMVYTEFIPSDGLIRDASKALAKLNIFDYERPVGIQLYGHEIEPMVEAARMAEAAGPDLIDINFGCPVRKIAGRGAGSGMMRDVPKMVEMTRRIVGAVKLPVRERVELAKLHLDKSLEFKGEKGGVLEMRRHLSCYFKGLPDFKATRLKLVTLFDPDEIRATLDYVAETWGDFDASEIVPQPLSHNV